MMTALKEYAEPYDWVVDQLKDWAYMVSTTYVFYNDGFIQDLQLRMSLQEGMEAYGGIAPSYIILLRDKPTLWWHFHSLYQCIHLTLSFMLADENNLLRMCDVHNVPVATNIATAEVLICALDHGDLDWREIVNPRSDYNRRRRGMSY